MRIPFWIGLRYVRAKRKNHFISFISGSSMLGIALGVMVLITVSSVMNGFEREIHYRILGMAPHVIIQDIYSELTDWRSVKEQAEKQPSVTASAPFILTTGMLKSYGVIRQTQIQGIDPSLQAKVSIVDEHMQHGKLSDLKSGEFGIILGAPRARDLGLSVGDKISVIALEGTKASVMGVIPRIKSFKLVGTFAIGSEVDRGLALVHLEDAQKLLRMQDKVTGLRLKVADVFDAPLIAYQMRSNLDGFYNTTDWTRMHQSLFRAVKMEKRMMSILLTFIIFVAAFNIVSTLVMVVTEKQSDIAILKTMGAKPKTILGIFIVQGSFNGVIGCMIGVVLGIALTLNLPNVVEFIEQVFKTDLVPGDVYFINFFPTELRMDDIIQVIIAALGMSFLATIYPALRAARVNPAEALKYE
jgi:lipoprotein-releasing system permease protein